VLRVQALAQRAEGVQQDRQPEQVRRRGDDRSPRPGYPGHFSDARGRVGQVLDAAEGRHPGKALRDERQGSGVRPAQGGRGRPVRGDCEGEAPAGQL